MKHLPLLLFVLLIALSPVYALASDITGADYYGTIRISNNSTEAENVATVMTLNSTSLIEQGWANDNLTNIAVINNAGADAAFMPSVNDSIPWSLWVPEIGSNTNLNYVLYTGNVTGGKIRYFPADGGMSANDSASLELGGNFTIEQSGWVDTTSVNSSLIDKNTAFRTYISASGNITSVIENPTWTSPTIHSDPESGWSDETKAYDDNTSTYANESATGWGKPLILSMSAKQWVLKVRYYCGGSMTQIRIQLYYNSQWNTVYENTATTGSWQTVSLSTPVKTSQARIYTYYGDASDRWLNEFDFGTVLGVTASGISSDEHTVKTTTEIEEAGGEWLSGYSYRVEIPISGSAGNATPYQMVDFTCYKGSGSNGTGYMYCNDNIDDNFTGIRFAQGSDGTTVLDEYVRSLSVNTSCNFTVAVPNTESSIYCYYDTGKSAQKYPLKHGVWAATTQSENYREQAVRYAGTYDRTYIAYQGVDYSAWLVAYDHTNGVWLTPKKIGDAIRADNHSNPGFDIVPSGTYAGYGHFFYGAHSSDDMKYYRANLDVAWDSITFTDKSAAPQTVYSTYPKIHVDDDLRIWWFFRGSSNYANRSLAGSYQYSDDNGGNWTLVNEFILMSVAGTNLSGIVFESGSTPKIHVGWTNTYDNVYYAYRNPGDGPQVWYDIEGNNLGTQITAGEGSTKIFTGTAFSVDMELDTNNYPWLTFVEGADYDDVYFYGWNGSSWDTTAILSGTAVDGTSASDIIRTSDTQVEAYLTELVDGVAEVRHYRGTYSGGSWNFALQANITSGSDEGILDCGNVWVREVKHANTSDIFLVWTYCPVGTPGILRSYPIDVESVDFDTVNPTNIFIDRFDRTYLSTDYGADRRHGIWQDIHAGAGGVAPDVSNNKLRIQVTTTSGNSMAVAQSDYDFVEGIRFRTSVEKSNWGASVRSIVGLIELGNGWQNQAAGCPNDGIRLCSTNSTNIFLAIWINGSCQYETGQTVGSGTNEIDVKYDFTTGNFSVLVDGVEKWSGDKSDTGNLTLNSPLSPFASGYNNAQETLYDYMTIGEYIYPEPTWGASGSEEGLSTTALAIYVDGVKKDSATLTANVTDNGNTWLYYQNTGGYWEYTKIWINGVLQQYIVWEYDTTFTDQSGNGHHATPTFRTTSSDPDVSAILVSFQPMETAKAPTYTVTDAPYFITGNITATGNFTSGAVPAGGPPGAELVDEAAEASGTPNIWLWGIFGGLTIVMGGLFVSYMERKYGSGGGSLLLRIVITSMVFGLLITFQKFDWWMLIFYLVIAAALAMASRHIEWGGNITQLNLIGFLSFTWVGLTTINRILEGQFITASETSFLNTLMFTQEFELAGWFKFPVINFQFFTQGIPMLLRWDYTFFGGNAQLLQYLLYSLTAIMSFIVFVTIIGLLFNYFSRLR